MLTNSCLMRVLVDSFSAGKFSPIMCQTAGLKNFLPPKDFSHIEMPERPKLPIVLKVPIFPPGVKAPKMIKNLKFMKGPELVHNKFIHKQYGIISLSGGRLKSGHFEMIRMTLNRKIDPKRMFLIWRVEPPWQPVTKKGQGQRMGGGKGAIDHYVTPIKPNRVIVELGGRCEFEEVKGMLHQVAHILPFNAMAISQEMLEAKEEKEKLDEARNLNEYTMEYIIKNNLASTSMWARRGDYIYFGKYI